MKYILYILLLSLSFSIFSSEINFKPNKKENITKKYKNEIDKNKQLVIVVKHRYKLYFYENKKLKKTYEIGLSQEPIGDKKQRGDNKLPEGEYYLIQKAKGPFGGKWGHYLGKRWIRISYPNKKDAISGLKRDIITKKEYNKILKATKEKRTPPKTTKLGGGIGIHGWIEEDWSNDENRNLTWGCITMHNKDIDKFYDLIKGRVKIIIIK